MSLLRLLSMGRSLVGLKQEPTKYKLEQNFLPKFESAKGKNGGSAAASIAPVRRRSFFQNPFPSRNRPKSNRSWVQCELALSSIKVMRNDLSEADVELIPVRAGSKRGSDEDNSSRAQEESVRVEQSEKPSAAPAKGGRNRGWSELTVRLFESGVLRT